MSKITKAFSADVTVADGERAVMARITTSAVDRDGEVLVPAGCNAKDYLANPVVFFNHDYWTLPVGKVTGLKRSDNDITAKVVFADRPAAHPADEEWLPDTLLSLFQQGVISGFSVGFTVNESRPATDRDIEKFGAGCRRVFSKWTLLELSVAPLPCNQEAVALAVSKGLMREETATRVFDYKTEAKADAPEMAKCSVCEKEYAVDDMTANDDGTYTCSMCAEPKSAEPRSEPGKRVVAEVVLSAPEQPSVRVVRAIAAAAPAEKCVRAHRVIQAVPKRKIPVRKLVVAEIKKRRGAIYSD